MLDVNHALAIVLAQTPILTPEQTALTGAYGRVLAQAVTADSPLPPFPAAIKDGYAVVAADGPGIFPVVGQVTAGHPGSFRVEAGQVAYITTGAPMPAGADAVVMVENSRIETEGRVEIQQRVRPGDDVRPVGTDISAGQEVLPAGSILGATEIGLLATIGVTHVAVHPRPRVAVFSTGDELQPPGASLGPGQIWDSNRPMLLAAAAEQGAQVLDLGIAGDSPSALQSCFQEAVRRADVVLTSGGVSMGELDLLKPLLAQSGQLHFGRIRMKPGKPLTFATVTQDERKVLVFALPGNPVSSLVTFYLMAAPALARMAGRPNPHLPRVQAHLAQALTLDPERPEYHRATLTWEPTLNSGQGGFWAASTGSQASSRLLSMRTANALLELPQAQGVLPTGSVVDALLIGPIGGALSHV